MRYVGVFRGESVNGWLRMRVGLHQTPSHYYSGTLERGGGRRVEGGVDWVGGGEKGLIDS